VSWIQHVAVVLGVTAAFAVPFAVTVWLLFEVGPLVGGPAIAILFAVGIGTLNWIEENR
jgi:hypothetical protein